MRYDDGQAIQKSAVRLSISMNTDYMDLYGKISVFEFLEVAQEVAEIGREQKSARINGRNRWKNS